MTGARALYFKDGHPVIVTDDRRVVVLDCTWKEAVKEWGRTHK
jgi:DTW domain-containing protein YfiP